MFNFCRISDRITSIFYKLLEQFFRRRFSKFVNCLFFLLINYLHVKIWMRNNFLFYFLFSFLRNNRNGWSRNCAGAKIGFRRASDSSKSPQGITRLDKNRISEKWFVFFFYCKANKSFKDGYIRFSFSPLIKGNQSICDICCDASFFRKSEAGSPIFIRERGGGDCKS